MSLEKAKNHLVKFGLEDRIRVAKESTATVALAAKAFGCEEKKIAKTLSFMLPSGPILDVYKRQPTNTAIINESEFIYPFNSLGGNDE